MEWLVGGMCVIANLIVTTVVGLYIKSKWEKRAKEQQEYIELKNKQLRAERQEDILTNVTKVVKPIEEKLAIVEQQLTINAEGTCAGLRCQLLEFYYDCAKKGFRTQDDSENFTNMYSAYAKLGGNSFIQKDISKWFYELPHESINVKGGK